MTIRRHGDLELMSLRRMSDSLEATRHMLNQAQQLAREAHEVLVGLASEFCGSELLKRQEQDPDRNHIPLEELAGWLRSRFRPLRLVAASDTVGRLAELSRLLNEKGKENEALRVQLHKSQRQVEQLTSQVHALERTLDNERQAQPIAHSPTPPAVNMAGSSSQEIEAYQDWLTAWKAGKPTRERESALIRFIGESGLSLSTELEAAIERDSQISPRTTRRVLQACVQAGLLDHEAGPSLEGRPPSQYTLTAKGRWLFIQLAGAAPKPPLREELLKAHKSDRHLAVILKAAELFERLGYRVDRQPLHLDIDANRFHMPDLVLHQGDETFYLEVECGDKPKPSLERKWENALEAGGRICVATDNLNTLRRIQGGILQWSRLERRSVTLLITHLEYLKGRSPGESPWYAVKEYTNQ